MPKRPRGARHTACKRMPDEPLKLPSNWTLAAVSCPRCGETVAIEYDGAIRRWVCDRCSMQWVPRVVEPKG